MYDNIVAKIYSLYPTAQDCISHLETVWWDNIPTCPNCESVNQTPLPHDIRYSCNDCNTTFSITTKTIFSKTKLGLQKWFFVIWLFYQDTKITAQQLGAQIGVTKNTAMGMMLKVKIASALDDEKFRAIIRGIK